MRKLVLTKKTGFKVNDVFQPIVIRDYRGTLFYTTEPLVPKVKEFNLPEGTYFVDTGYFTQMFFPVNYSLIKLPFPERLFPSSANFKIQFGNNPNKCTIFWDKKTILFDRSFKEKPLYEIFFIRFHEEGHKLYGTEKYADAYAANRMLEMGFNPMQVGSGQLFSLSEKAQPRKIYLLKQLNNYVR